MEEEIWKPLVYHGEYFGDTHEISNLGNLRNAKTKKLLHPSVAQSGYYMQVISRGVERDIAIKIHRAVAENFVDGDKSLTVNHKDLNKLNNRWDNLEFISSKDNITHAANNGAMNHLLERDDLAVIADLWRQGKNFTEIGNKVGVSRHVVADYIHRKTYRRHQDLLDDDD